MTSNYNYDRLTEGDRVLVTTDQPLSRDQCRALKARLTGAFPDVRFTVIGGIHSVVVEHAGE